MVFCFSYAITTQPSLDKANALETTVHITSGEEFKTFLESVNSGASTTGMTYELETNLDLSSVTWFEPIASGASLTFKGTFNGNGHSITLNTTSEDFATAALFGANVGIIDGVIVKGNIYGETAAAGIAVSNTNVIRNCINMANISTDKTSNTSSYRAGGICAANNGTIVSCINLGTISCPYNCGGIAGTNDLSSSSVIEDCVNLGALDFTSITRINNVGGITGYLSGAIRSSYAYNDFTSVPTNAINVGTIVGNLKQATTTTINSSMSYGVSTTYAPTGNSSNAFFENKTKYDFFKSSGLVIGNMNRCEYEETYGYLYVPSYFLQGTTITETTTYDFKDAYQDIKTYFKRSLFGGGNGIPANPYLISSKNEWELLQDNAKLFDYEGIYLKLSTNIDLGATNGIGTDELPFKGNLDGDYHTLTYTINSNNVKAGLFSVVSNASVKNITLAGSVSAPGYVGGLIGYVSSGTALLDYIHSSVTVNINTASTNGQGWGGIIGGTGENVVVNIVDTKATGNTTGRNSVGGLIGSINGKLSLDNVAVYGLVQSGSQAGVSLGGIVGSLTMPNGLEQDIALTKVHHEKNIVSKAQNTGGIIGLLTNNSTRDIAMSEISHIGDITCTKEYTGGIVGKVDSELTLEQFMAFGTIRAGQYVGGIVGKATDDITLNSGYFNGNIIYNQSYNLNGATFTCDTIALMESPKVCNVDSNVFYNIDKTSQVSTIPNVSALTIVKITDDNTGLSALTSYWDTPAMEREKGTYPSVNNDLILNADLEVYYFSDYDNDYLYIADEQTFRNFIELVNNYAGYDQYAYKQTSSIAFTQSIEVIESFSGQYYGDYNTLTNVVITVDGSGMVGLFGELTNASIDKLALYSGTITTSVGTLAQAVGSICGYMENSTITNSYSNLVLNIGNATNVGGLCGKSENSSISTSFFTGTVNAIKESLNNNVGGIVGYYATSSNDYGIENSFTNGIIKGGTAGGIVGYVYDGTAHIKYSYSSGYVFGTTLAAGIVGDSADENLTIQYTFTTAVIESDTKIYAISGSNKGQTTISYFNADYLSNDIEAYKDVNNAVNISMTYTSTSFTLAPNSNNLNLYFAKDSDTYNSAFNAYNGWHLIAFDSITNSNVVAFVKASDDLPIFGKDRTKTTAWGSSSNPYLISNANQFRFISVLTQYTNFANKYFEVDHDIDLTTSSYTDAMTNSIGVYINSSSANNKPFSGSLYGKEKVDGQYEITGFDISSQSGSYLGVFAYVGSTFTLRNLVFRGSVSSTEGAYIGSLVGYMDGGTIDSCISYMSVSGYDNVGGLVGGARATGITVTNSIFYGTLSASAFGLIGAKSGTISNAVFTNSWAIFEVNGDSSYTSNGYGSVFNLDTDDIEYEYLDITFSNTYKYGFKLVASGVYSSFTGYLMNTNNVVLSRATEYIYPINLTSINSGNAVIYGRFCKQVTVNINGASSNTNATATLMLVDGYYYLGQTVSIRLSYTNYGYYFVGIKDKLNNALENTLSNIKEDLIIQFTMSENTTTVDITIAGITSNNSLEPTVVIGYTDYAEYDGLPHLDHVNLDNYRVFYYDENDNSVPDFIDAGEYVVIVYYLDANDTILGLYKDTYEITQVALSLIRDSQSDFAEFLEKVYDGQASNVYELTSLSSDPYFSGVIEDNLEFTFKVTFEQSTVGTSLDVTLSEFTILSDNYAFNPSYTKIFSGVGSILQREITISLAGATEVDGESYSIVNMVYTSKAPNISYGTFQTTIVFTYDKYTSELVDDSSWDGSKFDVGYYKIIATPQDAVNYAITLDTTYYLLINPATISQANFTGTNGLVYTGATLNSSVKATFVGLDEQNYSLNLSYYYLIDIAKYDISDSVDYYTYSNSIFTAIDKNEVTEFVSGVNYYILTNLVNAGTYIIKSSSQNANYTIAVQDRTIQVAKSTAGGQIAFNLYNTNNSDSVVNSNSTHVNVNDYLRIEFTSQIDANSFDGEYSISIVNTQNANVNIVHENGYYYILPTQYGATPVTFKITSLGETNYENRESANFVLFVDSATLYVKLNSNSFTYGDIIELSLVYYLDEECQNELPKNEIVGLMEPNIIVDNALKDVGLYNITFVGGSSSGYVFSFDPSSSQVVINRKAITINSLDFRKAYGELDPVFTYTVIVYVNDEPMTIDKLDNGDDIVLNGALSRTSGENVGFYSLNQGTLTTENNSNYEISMVDSSFILTIEKREIALKISAGQGKPYGGVENTKYNIEVVNGYSVVNNEVLHIHDSIDLFYDIYTITRVEGETVGTYRYIVVVNEDNLSNSNYDVLSLDNSAQYTITKANPGIVLVATGYQTYGSDISTLRYTYTTINSDAYDGTLTFSLPNDRETFDISDTFVYYTFKPDNTNYLTIKSSCVINVSKREVGVNLKYNGENVKDIKLGYTGSTISTSNFTYELTNLVEGNNDYSVEITINGDSRNVTEDGFTIEAVLTSDYYELVGSTSINCVLSKASLIIEVEDAIITQGEKYNPNIKYTGFVGSDNVNSLKKKASIEMTIPSVPGYYTVYASGAESDNYEFTYSGGILTINGTSYITSDGNAKVTGAVSPSYKLTTDVFTQGDAFDDVAENLNKKINKIFFIPSFNKLDTYISVNSYNASSESTLVYSFTVDNEITEDNIIYVKNANGEVVKLEEYEISEDGKTITFEAGDINGVAIYSAKEPLELVKSFLPLAGVGLGVILIIVIMIVVSVAKKKRRKRILRNTVVVSGRLVNKGK